MQEKEIILRCQKGDKSAFHELIAYYYPYVTKFLLNLTRNPHLTEDLVQDTFIRMIRGIDKFNPNKKVAFSTYLMTIAKNLYLDYLRKEAVCLKTQLDKSFPSDFNLEEKIILNIECQAASHILKSLPASQADAIQLKYLEQLSLNEIAVKLGCESKTVKSRIHNGMLSLRKKLLT